MKFCNKCGSQLGDMQKFCNKCGNPISTESPASAKTVNINTVNAKESAEINTKTKDTNYISDNAINKEEKSVPVQNTLTAEKDKNASIPSAPAAIKGTEDKSEIKAQPERKPQIEKKPQIERKPQVQRTPKVKKPLSKGFKIVLIAAGIILASLLITAGIFHKLLLSQYYMMKCNNTSSSQERIIYATKAIENNASDKTKALVKEVYINVDDANVAIVQQKLKELSNLLSSKDYKEVASCLEEKKLNSLCKEENYEDALSVFNEIYKLGGDFKSNKNYDTVMLNTIASLTGENAAGSKNTLLKEGIAYYENLDDDVFDEIIYVEQGSSYFYSDSEIQLYKYNDGKYELVSKKSLTNAGSTKIADVQDYEKDKKGIFISYKSDNNYFLTLCDVKSSQLGIKGTITGNKSTAVQDIDNDNIYEGRATSESTATSRSLTKWYKFNSNGSEPKEVKNEIKDLANNGSKPISTDSGILGANFKDSYIFPNADVLPISSEDLMYLSKDELALARNELFARHGFVFGTEPFKTYFENKSWYHPDPSCAADLSALNDVEKENCKLIQKFEESK